MIKKKNERKEIILFENEYFIEKNDSPDRIIGRLKKEDIGKLFKTQELVAIIEGLGDESDENIVAIPEGKKIKLSIETMEDEEE